MGSSKTAPGSTRQRLLRAACEVFAQKGFRDATIADICERAGANIAAVNYHFGDKESLYVEAWHHSFHSSIEAHPPDGGVPDDAPPEERFYGRLFALLRRVADDSNAAFTIVHRELANPTGLLHEVKREAIGPLREKMHALVRELLGEAAADRQVRLCTMSVISQCMGLMHRKRMGSGSFLRDLLAPGGLEELARHIATFSLAGIRAIAQQGQARADDHQGVGGEQ